MNDKTSRFKDFDELKDVVEKVGMLDYLNGSSNVLLNATNSTEDQPLFNAVLENPEIIDTLTTDELDFIKRVYNDSYLFSHTDSTIPKVAVLQLADKEVNRGKKHESLDSLKRPPNVSDYDLIFCDVYPNSPVSHPNQLNSVYDEYNSDKPRPSTYYGHSISVSDVIVFRGKEGFSSYYVNGNGFQRLDGFLNDVTRAKIDAFMDVREEYVMLDSLSEKGISNDLSTERLSYIHDQYTPIFELADKRSILEDHEKLKAIWDNENLYGVADEKNGITYFHERLNMVFLKNEIMRLPTDDIRSLVEESYKKALENKNFKSEESSFENYRNALTFKELHQKLDLLSMRISDFYDNSDLSHSLYKGKSFNYQNFQHSLSEADTFEKLESLIKDMGNYINELNGFKPNGDFYAVEIKELDDIVKEFESLYSAGIEKEEKPNDNSSRKVSHGEEKSVSKSQKRFSNVEDGNYYMVEYRRKDGKGIGAYNMPLIQAFVKAVDENDAKNIMDENLTEEFYIDHVTDVPASSITPQSLTINFRYEDVVKNSLNETKGREVTHGEELNKAVSHSIREEKSPKGEEKSAKDKVMERLRNGIKEVMDSVKFHNWCTTIGKFYLNNYSFRNAMLTYIQKPESSYVMGYEKWKDFGRQVKSGAKGIKILAPVFVKEHGGKGSLLSSIMKNMREQFKKDPNLEFATFKLWQSKLVFNMYKNGLFDIKMNDNVLESHVSKDVIRKFLDNCVIGKMPAYYNVVTVFDVSDVKKDVDVLWVKKGFRKDELILDGNKNPIKNGKGEYKITNSDERRNRFVEELDMSIPEQDAEKMEVLYEVLVEVCRKKNVTVDLVDKESDNTLKAGALGYYSRVANGIVLSSDLTPTEKVSNLFHEIGHAYMHKDLLKLKDTLSKMNEEDVKITKNLKEVQAEALACMTASNFGIDTETQSFNYLASWSKGREVKELEVSMDYIWKNSKELMSAIENELHERGLDFKLEAIDFTPLTKEEKTRIVQENKEFLLNESRKNEGVMKQALEDLESINDSIQKTIICEQVEICRVIEEKLSNLNKQTESFDKSENRTEQNRLSILMKSEREKISVLKDRLESLSGERVSTVLENNANIKSDIRERFTNEPLKLLKQLQKESEKMKELSPNDLKTIATSKYISLEYKKYLGVDNDRFIDGAIEHLQRMRAVQSKNQTVVEIGHCECWGENEIFKNGTVLHPKQANKIISQAEKQIRSLKLEADKRGDYYPYTRCTLNIYTPNEKGKLSILNTSIDVGDGTQKNLTEHLEAVCKRGVEKKEVLANFKASVAERVKGKDVILTPRQTTNEQFGSKEHTQVVNEGNPQSMEAWKTQIDQERENGSNEPNNIKDERDVEDGNRLSFDEIAEESV